MTFRRNVLLSASLLAALLCAPQRASAEVILQYFNYSWKDLADKMPELAEVGYGSLWLPPPTKGSGGLSVGYDLWDPFDLGSKDQRNTVKTRYGTEAELIRLIETAHRFGIRVYFDNIMNHRAFDVPGYNESTPIDVYPGMVPEDFHLRVTEDGFYRKWDNVGNWNDAWQVQNRNFSDLIDIAHETPNANFGQTEGSSHPKITLVRMPSYPELYDYHPTLGRVGFYNTNITTAVITNPANFGTYGEDVGGYLMRAVRWLVDRTKVDGLRLDAVKHVPSYFFGDQGGSKDTSSAGYTGQAQEQFNITRGFGDANHRDSVFNTEIGRDDMMMFGEHLGSPPGYGEYVNTGMRLVDATLKNKLNDLLGNPSATLFGMDATGVSGDPAYNDATGVMFAKSHDDDYASRPELHYAYYLTRRGLPNIYTDGNFQSETLAQSGGAFPRHANTAFLGQFGDSRIPNLVYIHNHFARDRQKARWGDNDVVAYERLDDRQSGSSDADKVTMFFAMNDNFASGSYREIPTSFNPGAILWQYSSAGGGYYYTVPSDGKIKAIIPSGGYFAFSWRTPDPSYLWQGGGGDAITIYQNNQQAGTVSYVRKDGPDGDAGFNPYGVPDTNNTDFSYTWSVPRITSPTNIRFVARVDGSAVDVDFKLDGGIDLNSQMGINSTNWPARDRPPPAIDVFQGYEDAGFVQRIFPEKFAARTTTIYNVIGSFGAETFQATIGSTGFVVSAAYSNNATDYQTADWVYHNPNDVVHTNVFAQFLPAPQSASGSNVQVWVKIGYGCLINRAFIYYTTDGVSFPEGAGGEGLGNTKVVQMEYQLAGTPDGNGTPDWWRGVLPPMTNGTILRYKISSFQKQGDVCNPGGWAILFPSSFDNINRKTIMMSEWEITNFNAGAVRYVPHNDLKTSTMRTGLVEGFHFLSARAFLERGFGGSSLYNTFTKTFYYDSVAPTGQVIFPAADGADLQSQEYGVVFRTDPTVRQAYFNISDSNPLNDDGQTGQNNGNGTNALGQTAWIAASSVTPSLNITSQYPDEWRFTYRNIPATGVATMHVRLAELSSSTNLQLSDAAGHFGTIQRLVDTMAPTQELFVAFPTSDGEVINDQWNYVMKVRFSKSLANGIDENTLRSRFLLKINGSVQAQSAYGFDYDVTGSHHDMKFELPDLFNGNSNFLHSIEVTHTTGGGVILQASRLIKAVSAASGPYVSIVSPPEVDSDGQPFAIVLPDVAAPTADQRQYPIKVDTDLSASNVWITFTTGVGQAPLVANTETPVGGRISATLGSTNVTGTEKQLTGSVSVTLSNNTITGTGTLFTNELTEGFTIRISTNVLVVTQVVSHTSIRVGDIYPDASATGLVAFVKPAFDSDFQAGATLRISTNLFTIAQIMSPSNLVLDSAYPSATSTNLSAFRVDANPSVSGNRRHWTFLWTNITEGFFTFVANVDTNNATNTVEATATRNITVQFRESVANNPDDTDNDDDGLLDANEETATALPSGNSETWNNGEVHVWAVYGKSDPLSPDSDGDGLPDGLESGWQNPISTNTLTTTDTDGDGYKNFIADLDPPFFNTVPDNSFCVPNYNFNDSRTKLIGGTLTDANNPDTDYDGIPDGIEDGNRNGWIDGDGLPLYPGQDKCNRTNWPTKVFNPATWLETDPNDGDTDNDSAGDGQEDADRNGRIAGDVNSNRVREASEAWTETNPLDSDTDDDGLPDGWELQYSFDGLDNGTDSMRTTNALDGSVVNGAAGNPDGDTIIQGTNTVPYSNLLEFQNGTNPRIPDTGVPPPEGSIVIGRGAVLGVIDGRTNYQEFTDWTWDDLVVLDEYEGDGPNNQQGDIYPAWDGFDTSRDIVAFYARDGGDPVNDGDGNMYFRVDLHDLQAFAENGSLDLYVVIDTGNPAAGEMALPRYETEDVDLITSNRWEAVIVVDSGNKGSVFVDLNPTNNSVNVNQNPTSFGVVERAQGSVNGFKEAYFNSDLDAVEFSISRQALKDAGWNGLDASDLNYQVFSTRDGTCNSCAAGNVPGAGDIGGRNDVRDSIYDDNVAEDYWQSQASIPNALGYWFSGATQPGRAKASVMIHGNQAILPGSQIQNFINTGFGAGYFRPLAIHDIFDAPMNLHVTPTLASAIEWARVDTNVSGTFRDGPTFNRLISTLVQTNVVDLLGGTFSDHILPYFTPDFNRDNSALAKEFYREIYGVTLGTNAAFWTPERVADNDVFSKILDLGYGWTMIDQNTHMFKWFGRNDALGENGYRVNRINGVKCFVMNDGATSYIFSNNDQGLPMALRGLFSRKARAFTQDQVVTVFSNWEEFTNNAKADGYEKNVRWIANHPWVALVTFEQIASGQVDLNADGNGDTWFTIERGTPGAAAAKQSHDFINHSSQGNYDNWYVGSVIEESLQDKFFQIRPGTNVNKRYGMMYNPGTITDTWTEVVSVADTNLAKLGRSVLHASVFETAFHDEDNFNLQKFSTGDYVYPDTSFNGLAAFSRYAQAQTRFGALTERVDDWAAAAASITNTQTSAEDVDLDGEAEYLLYNKRVFAVFERIGGRMVAVFVRDVINGRVFQALGNQVSYAGFEGEEEGVSNVETNGGTVQITSHRTSGLKDWFASSGGQQYNNMLYSFINWTNGWRITSTNGTIRKTVTLHPADSKLEVAYVMSGAMTNQPLYTRHGLSPNLYSLLIHGQRYLSPGHYTNGVFSLMNTNYDYTVLAEIGSQDAGHNTPINTPAQDDDVSKGVTFYTINMRNQAQTHQVELVGTNSFAFSLNFRAFASDWDNDGLPNIYEGGFGFLNPSNSADGALDQDLDGVNNANEYVMGTDPGNSADYLRVTQNTRTNTGIVVEFPTEAQRDYFIWYANDPQPNPPWLPAVTNPIPGTGSIHTFVDDGTFTSPAPGNSTNRRYQIRVGVPQ